MKFVQVLAEQSSSRGSSCLVESLASHSCAEIALSQTRQSPQPKGSLGSAALSAQQCVSVVPDCQFSLGTLGEKNPEPMAGPAVFFHVQQEKQVLPLRILLPLWMPLLAGFSVWALPPAICLPGYPVLCLAVPVPVSRGLWHE